MDGWTNVLQDVFKGGIKTAVDYNVADRARDNGFLVPDSNMFSSAPEQTVQPVSNNVSPTGQPLVKLFYKADGTINPLVVGGAALGLFLLLK